VADCSIWVLEFARAPDSPASFLVHRQQGTRELPYSLFESIRAMSLPSGMQWLRDGANVDDLTFEDGLHLAAVSLRPGDWSRLDLGGAA